MPDDYHRKQTIAGGERFVTPALKDYETRVLGADERILERELELFEALRQRVAAEATRVLDTAQAVATLDVLAGFAETATLCNYTKPLVDDGEELIAVDLRHPVVERLASGRFVPNDVRLDGSSYQLVILTGPNMGGKSTYLRQVALLCLLAQAGSFVPAREAKVGIVDRIYARVGASDNISRGQSTFMVEMQETAHILSGATARSLVVLDEIGRGTATFDGLSIAWAVAEHLAKNGRARPKTLFATHYHELTDLADAVPGVVNAHVAVREWKDEIVFLHKILPGRSDRSYGIHVARLAGLPPPVIARARDILSALEQDELTRGGRPALSGEPNTSQQQLGLFQVPVERDTPLRERLREVDLNRTTPLEALQILSELKKELSEDGDDAGSSRTIGRCRAPRRGVHCHDGHELTSRTSAYLQQSHRSRVHFGAPWCVRCARMLRMRRTSAFGTRPTWPWLSTSCLAFASRPSLLYVRQERGPSPGGHRHAPLIRMNWYSQAP